MANVDNAPASNSKSDAVEVNSQTIWLLILVALTWGGSWIAIKFQVGVVPQELSVAYRFGISAAIMFAVVVFTGRRLLFTRREHARFLIAGLMMFSTNYLLFYHAADYVVSGFLALIFSLASIFNIFNSWMFLGFKSPIRVFVGALLGVAGLAIVFLPSMSGDDLGPNPAIGIILAVIATFCFSLGNIASSGYRNSGIPVYSANAYAMAYGAIVMALLAVVTGKPIIFEMTISYSVSLILLAVFSSVLAFAAYITLIGQIGASRAGYVTVVFPIIALGLSTIFEGYQWTLWGGLGLAFLLIGNVVVLRN